MRLRGIRLYWGYEKHLSKFKNKNSQELKDFVKNTRARRRRLMMLISNLQKKLRKAKDMNWDLQEQLWVARYILGSRHGGKCPAKRNEYGRWICKAKNYQHSFYEVCDLFAAYCFACKLDKEEARVAMQFKRILGVNHGQRYPR